MESKAFIILRTHKINERQFAMKINTFFTSQQQNLCLYFYGKSEKKMEKASVNPSKNTSNAL
jgi:hypothetical protein